MSPQQGWDLLEPSLPHVREAAELCVYHPDRVLLQPPCGYPQSDRACNLFYRCATKRTDREGQVATKELSAHLS